MKRKNVWAAIVLIMMAAVVAGCSKDDNNADGSIVQHQPDSVVIPVEPPTSLELTRAELEMVNSSNEFAFNLFRTAQDEVKSQILSPLSVTFALGMLNNGAAGETQQQINKVLGFGDTGADGINDFCYKMLQMAPTLDPLTKVMIANTIFVNKPYELMPDFVQKAKTFYYAEPESRNFYDGLTMDVINKWASDHTEGLIEEVLNEFSFDPNAYSYLLNAIYFKGTWAKKFDKALTQDEVFEHAGMTKELIMMPMMHDWSSFDYAETDDYQALRLPYGNKSFAMTVLLPKVKDGQYANKLPEIPTAETWHRLCELMRKSMVEVKLPRFQTDSNFDLIPLMKELGISDAFVANRADFQYLFNMPTFISLMTQTAIIKLDEEGTEAAAVTKDGACGSERPISYVKFHANHPFLYVISEQKTGAVFFIGQFTGR